MVLHGGLFFRAISFFQRGTFRLQSQGKNAIFMWARGSTFLSQIFIVCSFTPHFWVSCTVPEPWAFPISPRVDLSCGDAPCLAGVWGDGLPTSVHFRFWASHPLSPSPEPLPRALCSKVTHSACPICGLLTFFHQLSIFKICLQSSWMLMFLSRLAFIHFCLFIVLYWGLGRQREYRVHLNLEI